MKKIFLYLMILVCVKGYAQDFDALMTKVQLDCSNVSYNSALLFEKYYTENKIDSAKSLLIYWANRCGSREPVFRAKLLLAMKENSYHDSLITEGVLSHIFNYQNRMEMLKQDDFTHYDLYKPYYSYIPVGLDFDKFTKKEFAAIKPRFDEDKIEYLWCEFYGDNYGEAFSDDDIFTKLQSNKYSESTLAKEYNKAVQNNLNTTELHASIVTGIWIPTGKLQTLGVHPKFGAQVGAKHKKMNYDLSIILKFSNTPNEYFAKRKETGELEASKSFFGGYIGFDIGRDVYVNRKHEMQITGGIALDGFDALPKNQENDLKATSIWSYNFNLGIGYRFYIKPTRYISVRAKYNIIDYTLNNVIDLTGNAITIQFIYGGLSHVFKHENLKSLKYKYRR